VNRFLTGVLVLPFIVLVPLALATLAPGTGAKDQMKNNTPDAAQGDPADPSSTVDVRVFDTNGQLVGPISMPRVQLTEDEWKSRLSPEQFRILRNAGTEQAFCGTLLDNKMEGVYACAGCGLPMFSSDSKFNSGSGWPSYYQPIAAENITERRDVSFGMVRVEIVCTRCEGHLGHVFDDGPRPTGLRYCLNSESLTFTQDDRLADLGEVSDAVFAGGCFWCVEAVFEELKGVYSVESGYTGGDGTPAYKDVTSGTTGHAEAVRIVFDPKVISYEDLLRVHFATHDPTTLNRQGADVGTQYRSAIFYRDDKEKAIAEAFIADLNDQGVFKSKIVTTLEPLDEFHVAEPYHQDYVCNNPNNGYVRAVAMPKVEKVREKFADKLKETAQPQP
jgi:peptide methionine sulfoxide reductase msrA/msrB